LEPSEEEAGSMKKVTAYLLQKATLGI